MPLGLVVGKTIDLGGGHALDLSIGPYWYAVAPEGGAEWSLKFGVNLMLP